MRYLIGIDDTDNLDSRGTGFRARQLGELLMREKIATLHSITRHQLLVSPLIPYTSHNSSACLTVTAEDTSRERLADACRNFLLAESASGSDAGLCIAEWDQFDDALLEYGMRAKAEVLNMAAARSMSAERGILLEGLTGNGGGIIGSLAGTALRRRGSDGRFLWLSGMRELSGSYTVVELKKCADIDVICDVNYIHLPDNETIDTGAWLRPILRNGESVLLVEKACNSKTWNVISKEFIKQLSN